MLMAMDAAFGGSRPSVDHAICLHPDRENRVIFWAIKNVVLAATRTLFWPFSATALNKISQILLFTHASPEVRVPSN